ncbi:hypothetical protein K435DRAFT_791566 [Dendrothele bispora CBS 962.96]|uniref:Uncharacterized protein n=1 Tax=Dendrothele bispora (strain CBS 962.96) TaxID=1314807 RepID=A0A4S8MLD3_DENBC|nr:hypothetical protein K435DRAFT_791566 [Dendrothele bispora CBS 962.96]
MVQERMNLREVFEEAAEVAKEKGQVKDAIEKRQREKRDDESNLRVMDITVSSPLSLVQMLNVGAEAEEIVRLNGLDNVIKDVHVKIERFSRKMKDENYQT